jgi:sterol desaturase/sphingolipid hydroxylase (fatty acid hydroxylase superfamily)
VHHSADPRDYDSNFAGTFAWIDRAFGTYRHADDFPAAVGLGPAPAREGATAGPELALPVASPGAR